VILSQIADIQFVLRIILGVVFLVSSTSKIRDYWGFSASLDQWSFLPSRSRTLLAQTVIFSELIIVIFIMIPGIAIVSWLISIFLMCIFSSAIGYALIRRQTITCHCFTSTKTNISIFDLIRNFILVFISFTGFASEFWFHPIPRFEFLVPDFLSGTFASLVLIYFKDFF
jgi:uncharacterized membrane protein YphA (DoxX/SURF4 family)